MPTFPSNKDEEDSTDEEDALLEVKLREEHKRRDLKRQIVGVGPDGYERIGQQGQKLAQRVYTQIRCMNHAIEHDRATKIAWEFVMSTSLIVEALNKLGPSHVLSDLVAPYNSFSSALFQEFLQSITLVHILCVIRWGEGLRSHRLGALTRREEMRSVTNPEAFRKGEAIQLKVFSDLTSCRR